VDIGNEVMNEHSMNVLSKLKPATSSFGGNKNGQKIAGCIFSQKTHVPIAEIAFP
jgi:hypothetical protein